MLTAMLSAVEALALEWAPGRVNAVTPGLMDTSLLHTAYGPERDTIMQKRAAILPGRRVGTAEEVAQVILMLMTNAYVMGDVVHVDGGGRFVSQCSIDPVHVRCLDDIPTGIGDTHASAVSAGRSDLSLAWCVEAENGTRQPWRALYDRVRERWGIPGRAAMSRMKRVPHPLRMTWEGGKRDVPAIHSETAQRICTKAGASTSRSLPPTER
jgi:Enoyl-(Acyl carrier protein) reductase